MLRGYSKHRYWINQGACEPTLSSGRVLKSDCNRFACLSVFVGTRGNGDNRCEKFPLRAIFFQFCRARVTPFCSRRRPLRRKKCVEFQSFLSNNDRASNIYFGREKKLFWILKKICSEKKLTARFIRRHILFIFQLSFFDAHSHCWRAFWCPLLLART